VTGSTDPGEGSGPPGPAAPLALAAALAACIGLAAQARTLGAQTLPDSPAAPLLAACNLPAKASGPVDGLCPLFLARLSAALPGRTVRPAEDPAAAAVLLDVLALAPGRLEARILAAGAAPGPALGTARADAPLDEAALAAFLDRLIAGAAMPP
jgi:hypothetical protein